MIRGRLIAESFRVGAELLISDLRVVRLGRHDVTSATLPADERHEGREHHGVVPAQPRIWTFVDIEAPSSAAGELAQALANALEPELGWWADFSIDDAEHVVVFAGRIFRYVIGDEAARAEAVAWGRSVGTPEHQLDWGP